MTHRVGSVGFVFVCVWFAGGCGGGGSEPPPVGGEDAATALDGATPGPDVSSGELCRADAECSDGFYCNGIELCMPGDPRADLSGCVPGDPPACDDGIDCTIDDCSEERRACIHTAPDNDGDGHADAQCRGADGAAVGDDCDDRDANRFPGNTEVCNGGDEDCNPDTVGFVDADGDGAASSACCNPSTGDGPPLCGEDCNDADADIRPGFADGPPDACDTVDNDCDGTPDEGCPCIDGLSRPCGSPEAMAMVGECRPGEEFCVAGAWSGICVGETVASEEFCDGRDNNCDGEVDENVKRTYYQDGDGDGFGLLSSTAQACSAPEGYVSLPNDCDDLNPALNPGSPELCDGLDNDCDGDTDEMCDCVDGTTQPCGPPNETGACSFGTQRCIGGAWAECVGAVMPEPESCNGADDDCDGTADNGVQLTYYPDADGDGFGDRTATGVAGCTVPADASRLATDCDDGNGAINPAATEVCDGVDNNCDDATDDACECSPSGTTQSCGPTDMDGAPLTDGQCVQGTQRCIDGLWGGCVGAVGPVAESCNGLDDDCDGVIDDGLLAMGCYLDADSDGYGSGSATDQCRDPARAAFGYCPSGYSNTSGDCNDANANVRPGVTEVCNGVDDNCTMGVDEGLDQLFYEDADGDGYGVTANTVLACAVPPGYAVSPGDCDDTDASVRPNAAEVCNGIDDDCDNTPDEGVARTFYPDTDGDLFGDESMPQSACAPPPGYTELGGDCNDMYARIHNLANEVCDGVDNDCDRVTDPGCSCVNDSSRSCGTNTGACVSGTQFCSNGIWGTCVGSVSPSTEVCNGLDDDCDGQIDDVSGNVVVCTAGQSQGCTTVCGTSGTRYCLSDCSGWGTCRASSDTCNGCDDDGNGAVDDGGSNQCRQYSSEPCIVRGCDNRGTRRCDASCQYENSTCNNLSESCNYCDDDGDGTATDDRGLAATSSAPFFGDNCADYELVSVTCSDGSEYVTLTGNTTYDRGAMWHKKGTTMGYEPIEIEFGYWITPPASTPAPGDGFAMVVSTSGGTTIQPGTFGGDLGVPYSRKGFSFEWRYYHINNLSSTTDTMTIRALTGASTGIIQETLNVPSWLQVNNGTSRRSTIYVAYYPPSAAGGIPLVRVSSTRCPWPNLSGTCKAMAGLAPSANYLLWDINAWDLDIQPGTNLQIGFTGATGAYTANTRIEFDVSKHNVTAFAQCDPLIPEGYLRIPGGGPAGRLEIFHNGEFGTITDDGFGTVDAGVACRQLGYAGGSVRTAVNTEDGTGRIWMDNLGCNGTESRLDDCSFAGWGVATGDLHTEDVGVNCF